MKELYKNIKKRRKELGMTQDELAKKVGYSDRSTIAKIEKGDVDLSSSKIKDIAEALNTTELRLNGWEYAMRNQADSIYDQYIDAINAGDKVCALTVNESDLLEAYRSADNQTREMAERILYYNKKVNK